MILFIVILIFNSLNNGAVIDELFQIAGFTYGPLLGLFAFGILSKRIINDRYVVFITLFSIAITYVYYSQMPVWIEGYKPGFELIVINGLITYIALYINSLIYKK